MAIITITKRSAARAEIEGAIRALADHRNYVAAELLASAAIDVIAGVCRNTEVTTFSAQLHVAVRPEKRAEVRKILRHPYNFMKHSDRDRNSAIDRYNTEAALWRIFTAIADYEACWKAKSIPMMVYLAWFLARFPSVLNEDQRHIIAQFRQQFGNVEGVDQEAAVKLLGQAFAQFDDLSSELENLLALGDHEHIER